MLGPANETFFLSGLADACGMTCDSKQTCLSRHGCTESSMSFETDVIVSPRHGCLGNRVRFKADIAIWRGMDARDHMHSKAQNRCCEMNLRLGENSFLCAALTRGAPSSTSLPTDVTMPSPAPSWNVRDLLCRGRGGGCGSEHSSGSKTLV